MARKDPKNHKEKKDLIQGTYNQHRNRPLTQGYLGTTLGTIRTMSKRISTIGMPGSARRPSAGTAGSTSKTGTGAISAKRPYRCRGQTGRRFPTGKDHNMS